MQNYNFLTQNLRKILKKSCT